MIAILVPEDSDLCRMARTCHYFAEAIIPPNSGVWRTRFLDKYDHPPLGKSSEEVGIEYKRASNSSTESYGTHPYQQGDEACVSRNHARIKGAIMTSDFLNRPIVGDDLNYPITPSQPYLAIQLAATYLALDLRLSFRSLRTDYDLKVVYGCDSTTTPGPPITALYDGEDIDLYQLLHIRNFWKRHLTNPDEDTFYKSYHNMPEIKRPKAWEEGFGNKGSLGNPCIHPLPITSADLQDRQTCADLTSHWDSTCALLLKLSTTTTNASTTWFPLFNETYPINPHMNPSSRTYFRGTQSLDHNHHHAHGNNNNSNNDNSDQPRHHPTRGFTETCPAQAGIPGWRRICFVIYEINPEFFLSAVDDNEEEEEKEEDEEEGWQPWSWTTVDFLWAYGYEGVIMPGGGIMMGKWRNMMAEVEAEAGPFIFWVV
ncbi:hypothetical protein EMCG_08118 [[Emmonsia] crescens]|uniref:Uncharacterized protein n=1 Tax=[Emmonsia] crescens TaxID=73230 RepID=A0A0G2JAQ6_9EURO|nr:hypothetical protein EMCG_08118 [Emmonsia crescens UAMH 3008]